ncbi:MAG: adenylate/guanylate cyclase domain-containing protein [Hyphomonadaceae bacterium]
MTEELGPRKLAAIMSIDVAGYSAMSEVDEVEALALVERVRAVLDTIVETHGGRVFNTAGDGFMLEFASASGALAAAEVLWGGVERRRVRVGVHVGDVMTTKTGDLLGHSVNVAARLQQLAKPGAVVVSLDVRRAVRGKLAQRLHPAGAVHLDKMSETIDIFTLETIIAARTRVRKPEPVLAILPFDNESYAAELSYFSDGVADEIISTLLRQSKIKVIGRSSAFQFRGERKREAAAELKASHILDGSVRLSGDRMRVSVHLVDAANGVVLWSERYDGNRNDAFTLEDEIAAKVAGSLRRSLSQSDRAASPIDPAAHDLYLRARQMWLMMSDVDEDQAAILLERAVSLAPDFADAWAVLASVRALLLPRDRDVIGSSAHNAALAAAERALELDPDCAQGMAALSLLKPAFAEHEQKITLVNEALKRTPNDPSLHVARAAWLYSVGRLKDAARALEIASLLDPLGPAVEGLRASLLTARGDAETAREIVSAAWMRWPDSPFIWYLMWTTLSVAGDLAGIEELARPENVPLRGVTQRDVEVLRNYVALLRLPPAAQKAECERVLDELAASDEPLALSTCIFAAAHGCADRVFDVINAALDAGRQLKPDNHEIFGMARSQSPLQLFASTSGKPLWKDPRFPALCARLGLAQYWLSTKKWPDCASETDYDFKAACAAAVQVT